MKSGLQHVSNGSALEKVGLKNLELTLLASADGTEVIHHTLKAGSRWALMPEEGWNALEFVYIIRGSMTLQASNGDQRFHAGDSIHAAPVLEDAVFMANSDTEFLYVSSRPVWHHYSKEVKQMMDLAISVEQKDGYTADHCQRIADLAMMVGEQLKLAPGQMHELNLGSFLHDVGKTLVPEHILGKPGALSPEEWTIMKNHTLYGGDILRKSNIPSIVIASSIVMQHHERFDGSGYPLGLNGNEICVGGAIVAVVDSYDAMTTDRVYRKGRTKEEALMEIEKGRNNLYHPDVVDAFLSISHKI